MTIYQVYKPSGALLIKNNSTTEALSSSTKTFVSFLERKEKASSTGKTTITSLDDCCQLMCELRKTLTLNISSPTKLSEPDVFFQTSSDIRFGKPTVKLSSDQKKAELEILVEFPDRSIPAEFPASLTFVENGRFIELNEIIRPSIVSKNMNAPFWENGSIPITIFLIAFLGGVILNFMPCVLPVLMIKLLDISRAVDQDRKSVRLGFLSSAVGIITSFFALAVFAILLKNFGFFVTWGMQFQQPVFITIK